MITKYSDFPVAGKAQKRLFLTISFQTASRQESILFFCGKYAFCLHYVILSKASGIDPISDLRSDKAMCLRCIFHCGKTPERAFMPHPQKFLAGFSFVFRCIFGLLPYPLTMKSSHCPILSRIQLFAMASAAACFLAPIAQGGGMHSDINILTYADFGQNKGRYAVGGNVNALLDAIRIKDGGVKIEYQVAKTPYVIAYDQGMINFSATADIGAYNAISPTFIATVLHNGSQNGSFAEKIIGSAHAINYEGIDIRGSDIFRLAPDNGSGAQYDYMIQRQSKLITDVSWNPATTLTDIDSLDGGLLYHSGGGRMTLWDENIGSRVEIYGAYQYVTGGINKINDAQQHAGTTNLSFHQNPNYGNGIGATQDNPMPNCIHGGDSGSPVFIYNETTKQYEYIAAQQSAGGNSYGQARGNAEWTHSTMNSFNATVNQGNAATVYLNAIETEGGTLGEEGINLTDNLGNSATLYSGTATDASGNALATYNGVKTGLNTWSDLSGIKDEQTWYAYGTGYLERTDLELFHTSNLVFNADHASTEIILNATVDLGVGYAEFNKGENVEKSAYSISSKTGEAFLLNSAGYVVNAGAEVHVKLNNPETYMREWRKTGAGALYIDGSGDTNALLALGGTGTTYLQQSDGHAAYNILASSGAKVVIKDLAQIERDFTFGAGGGTLDMNGNSMDWYLTNSNITADGFSVNALTEEAVITNSASTATTLTYKESGDTVFKGSFKDTESGALKIDYQGGGTWTLNSIHTDLSQNTGSAFSVSDGKVILTGTNTVHGMGTTDGGKNIARLVREDDWHYADAKMNVTVASGSEFELGSHARLTGTVTVDSGATYTMREGVKHQSEYIEGGLYKENTYEWSAFYGHKGDTVLNGTLNVAFSEGTTANTSYAGNISGSGNVTVDAADGTFTLTGNNTFTGTRSVTRGTLIAEDAAATGSSDHKWTLGEKAVFSVQNLAGSAAIAYVDETSNGVLALSQRYETQVNVSAHKNLIIGAQEGLSVQYGSTGTTEALEAVDGMWRLGGGGGELVVNYKLTGANKLVLGNEYSKGTVRLMNAGNDFSGGIDFMGSGVTLTYIDSAISKVSMNLSYGNRVAMTGLLSVVTADSDGILLSHRGEQNLDFSKNPQLFLGTEGDLNYNGKITVADGNAYRLTASSGTLTVNSEIGGAHDLVIDAQTYTGGTVVLNNVKNLTGDVTVMGYDSAKTESTEGSIKLTLTQDNSFGNAGTVSLKAGGNLYIGETTQRINALKMEAGSSITGDYLTDRYDTKASVLHLTIDSISDIAGTISVDTIHKYGKNTLELNNSLTSKSNLQYSTLVVEEGDVKLTANNAQIGTINLKGNRLDVNGVSVFMGYIVGEDGSVVDVSKSGSSIGSYTSVNAASGTMTLDNGGNNVTLAGIISADAGATLRLCGSGEWVLSNSSYGKTGGTIRIEDASLLNLSYGNTNSYRGHDTVGISGILDLDKVNAICAASEKITQYLTFDTIKLNGQNLTLNEKSKSATWHIGNLVNASENEATLTWDATKTSESKYTSNGVSVTDVNASRLIFNNENSFNGTVVAKRTADGRAYNSFVELAHDKALQNATLDLQGMSGANMALAVNTDNARIQGLTGNAYSIAYGGASSHINLTNAPTSSREATLTLAGSGSYDYQGDVAGLSITMTGAGTQTFSGSNVSVKNISALAGTLNFTNAPAVSGNIRLAQGATLNLGESFSLNAGTIFSLEKGASGTQGTLQGKLVLNGGTLNFDVSALNETASLLNGTYEFSDTLETQNISISNDHLVEVGKTYFLLAGDWTGKTASFADLPDYLKGTFTNSSDSLKATFSLSDGIHEWKDEYGVFADEKHVLFRDTTAGKSLNFDSDSAAAALRFVNDETYEFSGKSLKIADSLKMESGNLILENKLSAASYETVDGKVEIRSEAELALTDTQSGNVSIKNISGTGTLSLNLSNDYTNTLGVDNNFTGTTHVQSGNFTLNGSSHGENLRLSDGVNLQVTAETESDANLVLNGTTQVLQNGNALTFNGNISGEGTYNRADAGTLVFNGNVKLGTFTVGAEETTNTFNGNAEIASVTLQDKTTLSGTGSLETGNIGLIEGKTLTVDQLKIKESNAATRTWNSKTGTTIDLKNGAVLDTRNADYQITGTLNLGGDDAEGTMYVSGIQLACADRGTSTSTSKLNVADGVNFVITGESSGSYDGAFVLSNYGEANLLTGNAAVLNVAGTLTSNAAMTLMHNHGNVNVDGKLNLLKGFLLTGVCVGEINEVNPSAAYATVTVKNGGRVNAAGGTQHSNLKINLNNGATLGAIGEADSTITFGNNMTLGAANARNTITIDTAAHTSDADFNVVRDVDKGLTVDMTGTVTINGVTSLEVTGSGTLKHKNAFNSATSIAVQSGATLAVESGDTHELNTATTLNNSTLLLNGASVDGANASLGISAAGTIRATGTSTLNVTTSLNDSTESDSAVSVTYDVGTGSELKSSGALVAVGRRGNVIKTGTGTLALNNAGDAVDSFTATSGTLNVHGSENYGLTDLKLGANTVAGFYADSVGSTTTEADISILGTARFGAGAHLNANITLSVGSTLEVADGGLSMGSTVTLEQGILLGNETLARANALKTGETLTLFTGVDQLVLITQDGESVFADSSGTLLSEDRAMASSYFSNLSGELFEIYFTRTEGDGTVGLLLIPEPSAFGLIAGTLALALVASSHRRKRRR